jgi:hypothetical protein
VLFNHSNYYSHSATVAHWNLPRGGFRGGYGGRDNAMRAGEGYNRLPRGDNWAGRGYQDSRPQPILRTPERGFDQRAFDRGAVRPALPGYRQGEMPGNRIEDPRREAFNRMPEPVRPGYSPGYGNRPGEGNRFRSGGGYSAPAPIYRQPVAPARGGFGERSFEPSRDGGRGFNEHEFKQEKSGGFHAFGGGRNSDFSREQRMPKNFGHEKMPKAPHFSEHGHGGGGHSGGGHSGGGHLFGGHHH